MGMRSAHRLRALFSFIAVSALLAAPCTLNSSGAPLARWEAFSRSPKGRDLAAWLRCEAAALLAGPACRLAPPREVPPFYGSLGVFITLVRQGRVRGCYGAFDHGSDDFVSVVGEYLRGALHGDPRHDPLEASELASTRIVVTIAGDLFPVDEIETLDTRSCGVLIHGESGGMRVYVPAEVRTSGYIRDAANAMRAVQIQAFRAITIE